MTFNYYSVENAIDLDLRNRIETKIDILNNNPNIDELLSQKIIKNINQEALSHSYDIENQQKEYRRLRRVENPKITLRENFIALSDAWQYSKNLDLSYLSQKHLIDINNILEPTSFGLRNDTIKVSSSNVLRPSGKKLRDLLLETFDTANELPKLDASFFLHKRLLYLHPFTDGNGRTTRLYCNAILNYLKAPPLVIPASERNFYFTLLENSYSGLRNRKAIGKDDCDLSDSEKILYNYLASKLNTSLDMVIDLLDSYREKKLELNFNRNSKVGYIVFKKRLSALIKKRNLETKIRLERTGNRITGIKIKGDLSDTVLSNILDSMEDLKDFKIKEE